jgi:hypothetical protein
MCNYVQDNWVEVLPLAEFAYNNSIYQFTLMAPLRVMYNYHPTKQFNPPKNPTEITGPGSPVDGWRERDLPKFAGNQNRCSASTQKVSLRKSDDFCGQRKIIAIDQQIEHF